MHIEQQLLSRIIREGSLQYVLEWGIQEDDFRTGEGRGLFIHLMGYWQAIETSGSVPGPMSFKSQYPTFELCDDASMTTDALCAEVRRQRIILETREAMTTAHEALDLDPIGSLSSLMNQLMRTRSLGMKSNDDFFDHAIDDLIDRYEKAERGEQTGLFAWPWEPFNQMTGGVQRDDYVIIYGRPKSKKTFVLGQFIASVYDQGKSAIVYTKEMPTWQIYRRVAAAAAKLPYDEFRLGQLHPDQRRDFLTLAQSIKMQATASGGKHNIIAISGKDAPAGQDNMTWLRGKIEKYKPDVVFIDGLYLMSADNKRGKDHERVMQISRAARQCVLDTGIPIIATMQANRQASSSGADAELDEIAYSDAIGQDATVAIRTINEKGASPPTIALVLPGTREWHLNGIRIGGLPYIDMEFREIMDDKEIAKSKAKDSDDADAKDVKQKTDKSAIVRPLVRSPVTNGLGAVDQHIKEAQAPR